jgi:hypothetical protein
MCAQDDHNTFANMAGNLPSPKDATDYSVTSALSPFVASASHNYALSGEAVFAHLNDGVSTHALLAANDLDPLGTTRGEDSTLERGAYEFRLSSPAVSLSASSLNYEPVAVGYRAVTQTVTVINSGGSNLTITTAVIGGTNSGDFSATVDTCTGATVTAGSTCIVTVLFTAGGLGARSGTLTFTDNSGDSPQVVVLGGTGVAAIPVAPVPVMLSELDR